MVVHRVHGFVVASHAAPTLAVTATMTGFAWSIGWRGVPLALVAATILIGQLSVGWSNDAFDTSTDARAGRRDKPTVRNDVSAKSLWIAAGLALGIACLLSWVVAGPIGGSFHVLALAMAWLYNVALSRTVWSWLPYAIAFGSMPLFLYVGLTGSPGPWWTVVVFATIAVSAHLANALPDLETDRSTGVGGLVVRLGAVASARLCWTLLAIGTGLLVVVALAAGSPPFTPAILVAAYTGGLLYGTRSSRRSSMFHALLGVVVLDVVAIMLSPAL
jgi:4-hydroxybenzoate polyprenyltransferase